MTVGFAPAQAGEQSAELVVESNGATVGAELIGTGTEAKFEATPATYDFGGQPVGAAPSSPQTFTVTDAGTASLAIGDVTLGGADASQFGLAAESCHGATLAPGASCQIEAVFAPTEAGAWSATIEVGGEMPGAIQLSGTGTTPPPPPPSPPQSPSSGTETPRALLPPHKGAYVVSDGRRLPVRLRCGRGAGPCRMKLKLMRAGRLVGRWHGRLAAGKGRTVGLLLTNRGRDELRSGRRLRAALRIFTAGRRTAVVKISYRLP